MEFSEKSLLVHKLQKFLLISSSLRKSWPGLDQSCSEAHCCHTKS